MTALEAKGGFSASQAELHIAVLFSIFALLIYFYSGVGVLNLGSVLRQSYGPANSCPGIASLQVSP